MTLTVGATIFGIIIQLIMSCISCCKPKCCKYESTDKPQQPTEGNDGPYEAAPATSDRKSESSQKKEEIEL
eukprot:CAMPEP_0176364276 /NCGR_PEP_ID=MMETSP0126-20121128/19673_1 /TAXON_ID=141414 ORGANISM="Strombidinopsis acuminatum, Strain SPMC142" /NCGR_SAMPLE_ID=MMETSP0126 /ASSEMBLY_ACC=CAM_ASM_000229 /LENGTH=70 /DNA_ID=CAMNT_0017720845 /DNA_START=669 /DNA_END=881 /DNA_ORIENTATION=-